MTAKTNDLTAEDFAKAIKLIFNRLRTDAPPELRDFTWTQRSVLLHLEKGPATSAELARKEEVTPQSMGIAIALLEENGFVERKPHPTDGRQMIVKLTAKSITLRKRIKEAKETWLSRTFEKFDKKEKETLLKATELMRRMAEM